MNQKLLNMLTRHEGVSLKPYRDTVGKLTIGIGRNLDDVGISRLEADFLLSSDVQTAINALRSNLDWFDKLDEVRQAVLIDMCLNMGWGDGKRGLSGFKNTLQQIRKDNYAVAAKMMLASLWAVQVKGRATELAEMMKTGNWQN